MINFIKKGKFDLHKVEEIICIVLVWTEGENPGMVFLKGGASMESKEEI